LQWYAVWYLFQEDNPTAQRVALSFLTTTRAAARANIQRLAGRFLRQCRMTEPSPFIKSGAALLCDVALRGAAAPAIIDRLTRIANL
jgi:hypothetical protein